MISRKSLIFLGAALIVVLALSIFLGQCPWWNGFWTSTTAIILTVTLAAIVRYTEETRKMAAATEEMARSSEAMAKVQNEEIGLKKRPVVAIQGGSRDPEKFGRTFEFFTEVRNFSMVHAKARVKATIWVQEHGRVVFEPDHPYSGGVVWTIQAGGDLGAPFSGRLGLLSFFEKNGRADGWLVERKAWLRIESHVINHADPDADLENEENRNPTFYWEWDPCRKCWITLVARPDDVSFDS